MTRRALVVEQPGSLTLEERPELVPGTGEVVVRPAWCGVCGSDLELLEGKMDPAFVRYPLTLGHEWSGTITAVGEGVTGLSPGMRCVGEGIIPCGHCRHCLAGETNVCETYDEVGFTREGAAGDQVLLTARLVHALDDGVSLVDAALTEPSAVVLTGFEKARPAPGARMLIIGDGTIGLLTLIFAALWEPAEIVVAGRRPEQEQLARSLGATSFTTEEVVGGDYDFVVEAAGVPEAFNSAVRAARRGGTVLLLGLPPSDTTIELPADLLVNADLTLVASFGYTSAAWSRVVELLDEGRIAPGRIVTHRFGLDDFEQAFAELARPSGVRGKILLEIAGG